MKSVLDSRQLLAARVLADTGSFTLAGQQLSLTQSAVSHAIKALEEEVGCKLFTRTGKGVKVTPAGRHFLEYLDRILAEMKTARDLFSPRANRGKEYLRVGVSVRTKTIMLPKVLPFFQAEFPDRLAMVEPGQNRRHVELLSSNLVDLTFTVKPSRSSEFGFAPLFEDELRFIVAPSHPWITRGRVSYADLAGDALLVCQDYNDIPQLLGDHLRAEGIAVRHDVQLPDFQSIKKLVLTGRAIGVLPPWLAYNELCNRSLMSFAIGSVPLLRAWGLAYRRDHVLTEMEQRFIELCRRAVPETRSQLQGLPPEIQSAGRPETKEGMTVSRPGRRYVELGLAVVTACNFFADFADWGSWFYSVIATG